MSRGLAVLIVRLAAHLLPARLRDWGRAMLAEAGTIERAGPALRFALGCLGCALGERFRLPSGSGRSAGTGADIAAGQETDTMHFGNNLLHRPRQLAMLCGAAATGLGLAYMAAGGAPWRYFAMNIAALLLGLSLVGMLTRTARAGGAWHGMLDLGLASALLLTSLLGVSADGAVRWISVGGVLLQPGLFLVPVLALRFARSRDDLSMLAVLIAALALALQPDRAMAGALAAGMTALVLVRPGRNALIAAAGALAGLGVTLVRADTSPAMPFVDRVFYSSFEVHPLAGLAVLAGALLMLVPAIAGAIRDAGHREVHAAFGALWLGVILAAALGNYPTPLVGYGGSAILGYLLSLTALPPRAGAGSAGRGAPDPRATADQSAAGDTLLRKASKAMLSKKAKAMTVSPSA